jgi:hypothetical protein
MQNYTNDISAGWGYRFLEKNSQVKYFDQYFSYGSCRWKATTKTWNESITVNYIPTKRATNIITLAFSIFKKIRGK